MEHDLFGDIIKPEAAPKAIPPPTPPKATPPAPITPSVIRPCKIIKESPTVTWIIHD